MHLSLIDTCSPRQETILPKKGVSGRLTTARGSILLLREREREGGFSVAASVFSLAPPLLPVSSLLQLANGH